MRDRLLTILCLCSTLILAPAGPSSAREAPVDLPLFAADETLHLTIEGPLATMMRLRSDTDYYDGVVRYRADDGTEHEFELRFRTRGNYRRRKDTCRFPPIRLRFKKESVAGTVFEGQRALKLVTHCRPRSERYEQYVLKEYLAYKIMELHSPMSFRARLLKINWIDTEGKDKPDERYGFVIEHKNELAARLGLVPSDMHRINHSQLDPDQASRVAIFQYLIGNTDFSMIAGPPDEACCHNGILLSKDSGPYFPIPYDFDFAGLVDTPYAEPNPRFKIKSVKTRLYRGSCAQSAEVPDSVAFFLSKRNEVMQLVDNLEGLSASVRKRTRAFIEKFYEEVSNPKRVETKFMKDCS